MNRKGFAPIVTLLIVVGVLVIGAGIYFYSHYDDLTTILLKDSGSTNTGAFVITINPDGSGVVDFYGDANQPAYITQFPTGTLDYKDLRQSIRAVPTLQFQERCTKSASFGTVERLTYKGQTSGDVTCMPNTQAYKTLSSSIHKIEIEATCYNPNNTSDSCLIFRAQQNSTTGSGIVARVSVSPIPGCQQSANLKEGEYHPCNLGAFQATFTITKSDGTPIQTVSTDKNSQFSVSLPPGNYILNDISAGSSTSPHSFYDGNNLYNGMTGSAKNGVTSYNFTVPPHMFVTIDPWFDGNSFGNPHSSSSNSNQRN